MRITEKNLRRAARRTGKFLWPPEGRNLFSRGRWKVLPMAAALLIYADSSQACLTVDPGSVLADTVSEREIEKLAADSAASVVHASFRAHGSPTRDAQPAAVHASRFTSYPGVEPTDLSPSTESAAGEAGAAPAAATLSSPGAQPALLTPGNRAGIRAALEGEFAVMLAQAMRLRAPRGGWSPPTATSILTTLRLRPEMAQGIVPAGGWQPGRALTEGSVASLLNQMGLQVTARAPERELSIQEAEVIVARIASIFRTLFPAAYTEESGPATLELGNPRAPLSPSTP